MCQTCVTAIQERRNLFINPSLWRNPGFEASIFHPSNSPTRKLVQVLNTCCQCMLILAVLMTEFTGNTTHVHMHARNSTITLWNSKQVNLGIKRSQVWMYGEEINNWYNLLQSAAVSHLTLQVFHSLFTSRSARHAMTHTACIGVVGQTTQFNLTTGNPKSFNFPSIFWWHPIHTFNKSIGVSNSSADA